MLNGADPPDDGPRDPLDRADWLVDLGRVEEAVASYRAGVAAGHAHGWLGLAMLYRDLGRHDEAVAAWQAGIDAGLEHTREGLALLLGRLGRVEEAIAMHRVVITEEGPSAVIGLA